MDGVVDWVGQYLSKLSPSDALELLPVDIGLAATVFPVLAIADSVAKKSGPAPISWRPPQPLGDCGLVLDLLDGDVGARGAGPRAITPGKSGERQAPGPGGAALSGAAGDGGALPEMELVEPRARVFTAMRELFVGLARRRPVVLAIDDLQWADADSLALLSEHLLRLDMAPPVEGEARPSILLLATVRTDSEIGPAPELALALAPRLMRTLHLARLPPEEARDLVAALLRSLGDAAPLGDVPALLAEGSGHPLFLDALGAAQARARRGRGGGARAARRRALVADSRRSRRGRACSSASSAWRAGRSRAASRSTRCRRSRTRLIG